MFCKILRLILLATQARRLQLIAFYYWRIKRQFKQKSVCLRTLDEMGDDTGFTNLRARTSEYTWHNDYYSSYRSVTRREQCCIYSLLELEYGNVSYFQYKLWTGGEPDINIVLTKFLMLCGTIFCLILFFVSGIFINLLTTFMFRPATNFKVPKIRLSHHFQVELNAIICSVQHENGLKNETCRWGLDISSGIATRISI